MTISLALLLAISVLCDVFGQLAFKLGAQELPEAAGLEAPAFLQLGILPRMFANRWLLAGLAVYAVELVVWIRILAVAPLGVAFPLASLNILGVLLAGRWLLGERIDIPQLCGAALVTAGIALVLQAL